MHFYSLPRSTPESKGISSHALANLISTFVGSGLDMHSLMVLRKGEVISEAWWKPYAADRKHMMFSVSKSFTSTAAGFAVQEGRLTLADKVISFFPERLPEQVSEHLAEMTVWDLLTMSSGHAKEPFVYKDADWVRPFLAADVPYKPGSTFVYNTAATYVVSAILYKVTGMDLVEYLKPRLFDPLGIDGSDWEMCPKGVRTGGYGLSIRTEELAKFGQFLLQKGNWNGVQLLSSEWIDMATSKLVDNGPDPDNDWNQGYGFQFWRCRHGWYRADGAFGQFCIVAPEHELVIAITSGIPEMGRVLKYIWDVLLPEIKSQPIPENEDALQELRAIEQVLELRGPQEQFETTDLARERFEFAGENKLNLRALEVEEHEANVKLRMFVGDTVHEIIAHFGNWKVEAPTLFMTPGPLRWGTKSAAPYAARAGWTQSNELAVRICYVNSPYAPTMTLRLGEEDCAFRFIGPISLIESGDRPELIGRRV